MLSTSAERLEDNKVKLTVTIPAEQVDETINATYKRVGAKLKLPGFRPGKAPKQIVENTVGKDYLLQEATEDLVNAVYPKALDAELLRPIGSPAVEELDSVVPGEDFTFTALVPVRPELDVASTEGLEITIPSKEATKADIDAQVQSTRERFATLEPVDRPIEKDDFVLISFTGTVDGEPYEGNQVDKYLYEMNHGMMPMEFDDGLLGMTAGQEGRVEFSIPDTGENPEFAGKTAGFDITVHEVKAKSLPEVDDEFATSVGGFDNVDEMMADLERHITEQKTAAYDRTRERAARELIAERLVGDVPQQMIDSRKNTLMQEFDQMLQGQGMDLYNYFEAAGVTPPQFDADMAERAAQLVREELALEAIFRKEGMEVTAEEVDAELGSIAEASGTTLEESRERWERMGLIPMIHETIIHRKALVWLLDNTSVVEESGDAAESKEEKPKKAAKVKKTTAKSKE